MDNTTQNAVPFLTKSDVWQCCQGWAFLPLPPDKRLILAERGGEDYGPHELEGDKITRMLTYKMMRRWYPADKEYWHDACETLVGNMTYDWLAEYFGTDACAIIPDGSTTGWKSRANDWEVDAYLRCSDSDLAEDYIRFYTSVIRPLAGRVIANIKSDKEVRKQKAKLAKLDRYKMLKLGTEIRRRKMKLAKLTNSTRMSVKLARQRRQGGVSPIKRPLTRESRKELQALRTSELDAENSRGKRRKRGEADGDGAEPSPSDDDLVALRAAVSNVPSYRPASRKAAKGRKFARAADLFPMSPSPVVGSSATMNAADDDEIVFMGERKFNAAMHSMEALSIASGSRGSTEEVEDGIQAEMDDELLKEIITGKVRQSGGNCNLSLREFKLRLATLFKEDPRFLKDVYDNYRAK